jgi:CRP-like cAMP-binding protein/CheY-like chemotaxis protein
MASDNRAAAASKDSLRELFQATNLFTSFPELLLQQLQQATTVIDFMPEDRILKQGEINHNLFFLVIGTVKVYVDNGLVATLSRKGDLLGEMSVITKKPAAATIVAQTPVQLLKIDTVEFKRITDQNTDQFDHILYRIYSTILTDKLHTTNQKAKVLEETLQALNRAKSELQEINKSMESRVAERTAALGARLENLLVDNLSPLRTSMNSLKEKVPADSKGAFGACLNEIESCVRMLEPITLNFKSEASAKNKRVLVADTDKKQLLVSKMALGGTGVTLETVSDLFEANRLVSAESYDLVMASAEMLEILKIARQKNPKVRLVFLTGETIPAYLPKLATSGLMPNIVSRDENDKAMSIRNIMSTVTKLASNNIFGLEKYLNWGAEVKELPIRKSSERDWLREQMAEHFSKLGIRKTIVDTVNTVLEELLMNAIYDAPVDAGGKPIYNHLPRTEEVALKPQEQGRFRFACDGQFLAVSVEDPFGALTPDTTLKYLDSCYGGRAGEMQADGKKAGAGRGLHQIIENSQLVVFNVTPHKRTEVIALFGMIPGDKTERAPQFHFFSS